MNNSLAIIYYILDIICTNINSRNRRQTRRRRVYNKYSHNNINMKPNRKLNKSLSINQAETDTLYDFINTEMPLELRHKAYYILYRAVLGIQFPNKHEIDISLKQNTIEEETLRNGHIQETQTGIYDPYLISRTYQYTDETFTQPIVLENPNLNQIKQSFTLDQNIYSNINYCTSSIMPDHNQYYYEKSTAISVSPIYGYGNFTLMNSINPLYHEKYPYNEFGLNNGNKNYESSQSNILSESLSSDKKIINVLNQFHIDHQNCKQSKEGVILHNNGENVTDNTLQSASNIEYCRNDPGFTFVTEKAPSFCWDYLFSQIFKNWVALLSFETKYMEKKLYEYFKERHQRVASKRKQVHLQISNFLKVYEDNYTLFSCEYLQLRLIRFRKVECLFENIKNKHIDLLQREPRVISILEELSCSRKFERCPKKLNPTDDVKIQHNLNIKQGLTYKELEEIIQEFINRFKDYEAKLIQNINNQREKYYNFMIILGIKSLKEIYNTIKLNGLVICETCDRISKLLLARPWDMQNEAIASQLPNLYNHIRAYKEGLYYFSQSESAIYIDYRLQNEYKNIVYVVQKMFLKLYNEFNCLKKGFFEDKANIIDTSYDENIIRNFLSGLTDSIEKITSKTTCRLFYTQILGEILIKHD